METRQNTHLEASLWDAVPQSIVASAILGPLMFATSLVLGKPVLLALMAWGLVALFPTAVLACVLLITACLQHLSCEPITSVTCACTGCTQPTNKRQ